MCTSIFKLKKTGYFLLKASVLSLLICISIIHEADAQEQASGPGSVNEATNPAQQVPDKIPNDAQSVAHGKQLFGQHCTVCHMVEKQLIGPALASVHNRRPIPWLFQFIRNSQYVINETDDEYAQHLFSQYNEVVMPEFKFLSNEDIYNILAYIKNESVSPTSAGGVNGVDQANVTSPQDEYTDPDGEDAYSQKAGEEGSTPNSASGFSTTLWIVFGLSFFAVVLAFVYIRKEMNKMKNKENA